MSKIKYKPYVEEITMAPRLVLPNGDDESYDEENIEEFDVLAIKGRKVRWVQLTTITNIKAREKKVLDFLRKTKSLIVGEIWGYDKKKRIFKIIKVKI